jgi:carbamate kinase
MENPTKEGAMLVVVALGGNALLQRGQPMTAEMQRQNIRTACAALAPVAEEHRLVISHGNGPQVGLLALKEQAYTDGEPYPLDILDAQTEGMIGYIVEQELGNVLPEDRPFASLLTMIEVDPADPAFADPTKFVGPVYDKEQADILAGDKGWVFKKDGDKWRRVVASPAPKRIFEIQPVRWLVEKNTVVVCAGGGGIPTAFAADGSGALQGVEAVIDKDWASELLARDLGADVYVMATDTDGVYLDWGTPSQRLIDRATPAELALHAFPAGSMGPKVDAASHFVLKTGKRAAIGALKDIREIVAGTAGTQVVA